MVLCNEGKTLQQIADELGYKSRSAVQYIVSIRTNVQNPMFLYVRTVVNHLTNISMNSECRYQLDRYRGRGTRCNCPQCGKKYMSMRE